MTGRTTPMQLTDSGFEDAVRSYPVLVVMFIDYLYLDFYDSITREMSVMEELAHLYKGKIWFAVAEEEKNTRARKRYVGNAWSEKEIRVFINSRMVMKGISLPGVMKQVESIFSPKEMKEMRRLHLEKMPLEVNIGNIDEFIVPSRKKISVLALLEPGQHQEKRRFIKLSSSHSENNDITFGISYGFMLFNEETSTFYPNPVFERYEVKNTPSFIIMRGEKIVRHFGPDVKWQEVEKSVEDELGESKDI
jgi:hypothetical protein